MISDFAQETLDLARSLTAHHVELNELYCDTAFCVLNIGNDCEVCACVSGSAEMETAANTYTFGNVTAAIQAADTYETVMAAIRDAAKASREKVTA